MKRAVEIFKERYPKLNIAGYRNGYFVSEEEQQAEAQHITNVNPDFLIVGMGVLMQERFLLKVRDSGYQGIGFTCGDSFIRRLKMKSIIIRDGWTG